jgi:hypothetical protein
MATIRSQFADGALIFNEMYLITGTYNVSQFPNIPCAMMRIKVRSANTGSIFLGTKFNTGTVNFLPFEMEASYDTGWVSIDNLNVLYQGRSSGSSYFAVWAQK